MSWRIIGESSTTRLWRIRGESEVSEVDTAYETTRFSRKARTFAAIHSIEIARAPERDVIEVWIRDRTRI